MIKPMNTKFGSCEKGVEVGGQIKMVLEWGCIFFSGQKKARFLQKLQIELGARSLDSRSGGQI
jgi:hypothetical protein